MCNIAFEFVDIPIYNFSIVTKIIQIEKRIANEFGSRDLHLY